MCVLTEFGVSLAVNSIAREVTRAKIISVKATIVKIMLTFCVSLKTFLLLFHCFENISFAVYIFANTVEIVFQNVLTYTFLSKVDNI